MVVSLIRSESFEFEKESACLSGWYLRANLRYALFRSAWHAFSEDWRASYSVVVGPNAERISARVGSIDELPIG